MSVGKNTNTTHVDFVKSATKLSLKDMWQWAFVPISNSLNWSNAGILLIQTLGTHFGDILNEIDTFSFKKLYLKISFAK